MGGAPGAGVWRGDTRAASRFVLNLPAFLDAEGEFDTSAYAAGVALAVRALDIWTGAKSTRLSVGFADLAGLIAALGLRYDSAEARDVGAAIAALIDMLFLRLLSVYCRTELVEAVPPGDALKVAAAAAGLPLPLGFARNQATLIVASRSAWVARINKLFELAQEVERMRTADRLDWGWILFGTAAGRTGSEFFTQELIEVLLPACGGMEKLSETLPDAQQIAAWRDIFSKPIAGGPSTRGFDLYFGTDIPNWPPFCFIASAMKRAVSPS